MANKTVNSNSGTTGNQFAGLTASWAALPASTWPTSDVSTFGTFSASTNRWTAPGSGLPDGVLVLMGLQSEDTSNGRCAFALRAVNISGTGDLQSGQGGGYSRDTSEDRAYARSWAYIDNPGASSVWEIQGRRSSDAPNTGDEFVTGDVQFIPIYRSAVGMYNSQTTQTLGGTTYTRISSWNVTKESDTAAIELGGTTTDVVDLKTDNKKYLILGSLYMDASSNRTQRVAQLRADGTARAQGVTYLRSTTSTPNGTTLHDGIETVTTTIGIDMAACRGIGVSARQGGADSDQGISTGETEMALVIIELNDDAEWIRTHSTSQQECALTGPVDLNLADVVDYNDAASFTKASASAINVEQAMDALVLSSVNIPRNTSVSSGNRWTAFSEWTVNGTEQVRTRDGDYSRGNQSTTDTHGWSAHAAGVLTVALNDDLGLSVTELPGTEGGGSDMETEPFANNEGLVFIAINLDTLEASGPTTHTASGTPSLPAVTASGAATVRKTANGTPSIPAVTASGTATVTKKANGAATIAALVAAGTATVVHVAAENQEPEPPAIPSIEAAGVANVVKSASGSPSIPITTASGAALVIKTANGSPNIPLVTAAGNASVGAITSANGAPDIPAIEGSGNATVRKTANGSPSIPSIVANGAATHRKSASGSPSLPAIESAGNATIAKQANGSPSIPSLTASGVAQILKQANGSPFLPAIEAAGNATVTTVHDANGGATIPALTASGVAQLAPTVWLNTTATKVGATRMTVTAYELDGTEITFTDPFGAPTGSLWLGVENPHNDEIAWIGVTVSDGNVSASGAPAIPSVTASGAAIVHRAASGTPVLPATTAAGTAEVVKTASGTPSIPATTASGNALIRKIANGSPSIPAIVAAGTASVTGVINANGAPSIPAIEGAGNATVVRAASGTPTLPAIEGAGNAIHHKDANGSPAIPSITANGAATIVRVASGNGDIPLPIAAGTVDLIRNANGSPTLPAIQGAGTAQTGSTKVASGSPDIPLPTAAGTVELKRSASGAPTLPSLVAAGVAKVVKLANGTPQVPIPTAAGTVSLIRNANGSPSIPAIEAAGNAVTGAYHQASGSPSIPAVEGAGTAKTVKVASGSPSIPSIDAAGNAIVGRKASGNANVPLPVAAGTAKAVRIASGNANVPVPVGDGTIRLVYRTNGAADVPTVIAAGTAIVGGIQIFGTIDLIGYDITNSLNGCWSASTTLAAYSLQNDLIGYDVTLSLTGYDLGHDYSGEVK